MSTEVWSLCADMSFFVVVLEFGRWPDWDDVISDGSSGSLMWNKENTHKAYP
jgi:hypothetical protein